MKKSMLPIFWVFVGACTIEMPEPTVEMVRMCTRRGFSNARCIMANQSGACVEFNCTNLTGCSIDGGVTADGGIPCNETCDGRCGTYDQSESCQCDSYCQTYNDCCIDYVAICVADQDGGIKASFPSTLTPEQTARRAVTPEQAMTRRRPVNH